MKRTDRTISPELYRVAYQEEHRTPLLLRVASYLDAHKLLILCIAAAVVFCLLRWL